MSPTEEGECAWGYTPLILDTARSEAFDVSTWGGGTILGTALSDGDVIALDTDGAIAWSYDIEPSNDWVNVLDVLATPTGGAIVAAQIGSGTPHLVVLALSPTGERGWHNDLGAMDGNAWVHADIVESDGDYLVAWDGIGAVSVGRIDGTDGAVVWRESTSTRAPVVNWLAHALDVLPDGSALQLIRAEHTLRLVQRDAHEGTVLAESVLEGVDGISADLVVLPDGTIFVLANNLELGPQLLEVELDGTVVANHSFEGGDDEFFDVMAWDEVSETLLIAGTAREPAGTERPWRVVVDRDGVELFNDRAPSPELITSGLAVDARPGGGFVESRFPGLHVFEVGCSAI